jgi:hypothetical protein
MPATAATAHLSPVRSRVTAAHPSVNAAALASRARSLRAQAARVNPIVAQTYVRRAAELERLAGARANWPAAADSPAAA